MDIEEAIRTVRVLREFSDEPLPETATAAILNAGRRAGSSKNLQRWHFIAVSERASLGRLTAVGPFAGHLAGAALAIALVTPDPRAPGAPLSITWDSGRAAQNMVLAAWALGIGSVPATVYEQELARELLGYPAEDHCEYILGFGYPADRSVLTRPPQAGGRVALDEIVHRERW